METRALRGDGPPISPGPEVEEFATALDECLSPYLEPTQRRERILDLPRRFYENALRRLATKRPRRTRDSHDDEYMDVDDEDNATRILSGSDCDRPLEREIQTWDLVRRLLPLRHNEDAYQLEARALSKNSQKSVLTDFLLKNSAAREQHAIIQWLQQNAASGPDIDDLVQDLQANADRGDIIAHGWLHTRSKIKLRKSMTAWPHLLDKQSPTLAQSFTNGDGAPLVTQLDPDATTRQGRKLEPQDEYFERAIWLGCFEHLRRGSSRHAMQDWCQERTEMWRAVSMSALLIPRDNDDASSVAASPESLALWRRMCFGLAKQGGSDDYERAVYGVLSGDSASVEKVSRSWDDHLFARYNRLLRVQLDNYLLGLCPADAVSTLKQSFAAIDADSSQGDYEAVEKRIVRSLEAQKATQKEAMEPTKALQASIIAKELDRHLYEQGSVMVENARKAHISPLLRISDNGELKITKEKFYQLTHHDGMRITTHVYILKVLLEQLDANDGKPVTQPPPHWRSTQENVLAAYTDHLRRANLPELIPLYCSILEAPRRYEVLSWNLIHETDQKHREMQIRLIKKSGIDIVRFVEKQAELLFTELRNKDDGMYPAKNLFRIVASGMPTSRNGRPIKPDFFGEEEGAIEAKHERVIRALEWLSLVRETWPMVFSVGTKVYKYFLKHMHLNAARQLMERVSFAAVIREMMSDEDELLIEDEDFWSQHLDRSNIEGVRPQQVLEDARNFRELEALVKVLDNLETVASLVELSSEMPAINRDFWGKVGDEIKATKENMQPLLRSWLQAGIASGDQELMQVRQTYLPETILAYTSALHFAGTGLSRDNLLECMELSAVIAERGSDLAEVFIKSKRMTELVESFAACSKALAITTGEKRAVGSSNKKLREMGWSRDLWSVKS